MTDPTGNAGKGTLADRMDADYQPPILVEPRGGPVPDADETPDLGEPPE